MIAETEWLVDWIVMRVENVDWLWNNQLFFLSKMVEERLTIAVFVDLDRPHINLGNSLNLHVVAVHIVAALPRDVRLEVLCYERLEMVTILRLQHIRMNVLNMAMNEQELSKDPNLKFER